MDQAEAPDILETLNAMRRALAEVDSLIRQAPIADARETRGALGALTAAERRLTAPFAHPPGDPAVVAAWRHEMRGVASAMVGWGHVLALRAQDEATRFRALEAIERNAKQLQGCPLDPG
jgi:hypothetical protein